MSKSATMRKAPSRRTYNPKPMDVGQPITWTVRTDGHWDVPPMWTADGKHVDGEGWHEATATTRTGVIWSIATTATSWWVQPDDDPSSPVLVRRAGKRDHDYTAGELYQVNYDWRSAVRRAENVRRRGVFAVVDSVGTSQYTKGEKFVTWHCDQDCPEAKGKDLDDGQGVAHGRTRSHDYSGRPWTPDTIADVLVGRVQLSSPGPFCEHCIISEGALTPANAGTEADQCAEDTPEVNAAVAEDDGAQVQGAEDGQRDDEYTAYLMGEDASMTGDVREVQGDEVTVGEAIGAYLGTLDHPETRGTHRVYSTTLRALAQHFGADASMGTMTPTSLSAAFRAQWGDAKPSTSNSRRATISAWLAYSQRQGWVTDAGALMRGIGHRKTAPDNSRALSRGEIDKLLSNPKVPLRDKALWRMLYETAARSAEVLRLNVEDLDLPNRRARVQRKGGAIDVIVWQSGTAQLLPRLLNGRKRGPLFVTERKGKGYSDGRVAARDLTEDGRKRLSYRQAEDDFKAASGGATLHQLRHSALTHAAEQGTNTAMLMAKSGHTSVRSLAKYARVSAEALQRHQEATDPGNKPLLQSMTCGDI